MQFRIVCCLKRKDYNAQNCDFTCCFIQERNLFQSRYGKKNRIFTVCTVPKGDERSEEWGKLHNKDLYRLYCSLINCDKIEEGELKIHVVSMWET